MKNSSRSSYRLSEPSTRECLHITAIYTYILTWDLEARGLIDARFRFISSSNALPPMPPGIMGTPVGTRLVCAGASVSKRGTRERNGKYNIQSQKYTAPSNPDDNCNLLVMYPLYINSLYDKPTHLHAIAYCYMYAISE